MMALILWPFQVASDMFGFGAPKDSIPFIVGRHRITNVVVLISWLFIIAGMISTEWFTATFDYDVDLSGDARENAECESGLCGKVLKSLGDNLSKRVVDLGPGGYHEERTLEAEGYKNGHVNGDCYFPSYVGSQILNLNVKFHDEFNPKKSDHVDEIDQSKIDASYGLGVATIILQLIIFMFVAVSHLGRIPLHWASWAQHVGIAICLILGISCVSMFVVSNANDGLCDAFSESKTENCGYGSGIASMIVGVVLLGIAVILSFVLTRINAGSGRAIGMYSLVDVEGEGVSLRDAEKTGAGSSSGVSASDKSDSYNAI